MERKRSMKDAARTQQSEHDICYIVKNLAITTNVFHSMTIICTTNHAINKQVLNIIKLIAGTWSPLTSLLTDTKSNVLFNVSIIAIAI